MFAAHRIVKYSVALDFLKACFQNAQTAQRSQIFLRAILNRNLLGRNLLGVFSAFAFLAVIGQNSFAQDALQNRSKIIFNSGPDGFVTSIVVERYQSGRVILFEGYSPTTKKPVHFDKRLTVSLLDQTINKNRSKRLTLGIGNIAAGICTGLLTGIAVYFVSDAPGLSAVMGVGSGSVLSTLAEETDPRSIRFKPELAAMKQLRKAVSEQSADLIEIEMTKAEFLGYLRRALDDGYDKRNKEIRTK